MNEQKSKLNGEIEASYEQFPEYKIIYKALDEKDYQDNFSGKAGKVK